MAKAEIIPILTDRDFESLRNDPDVKRHLRFITPDHRGACGCYLVGLPVWVIFALYGGYAFERAGLPLPPWLLLALLAVALLLPLWPLFRVRRHMRRPVLDKLATLVGMDYASDDFEMKAFETALPILFGKKATSDCTDLLAGKEGGNSYAVCRVEIEADGGDERFSGLLHWFGRRAETGAVIVVLPPGDPIAAGAEPPKTMERIDVPGWAFQVYSDSPGDARALLNEAFRATLTDLARDDPLYAYLARNDAFLLSRRPPAFEPENPPADRAARLRLIFDNVAAAFATARAFRAQLG